MLKTSVYAFVCSIVLTALFSGGAVWAWLAGEIPGAAMSATAATMTGIWTFRLYRKDLHKVTFMFNAIENDDFNFKFTEYRGTVSESQFNAALNRIRDIVAKARRQAVEQEKYYALILESIGGGVAVADQAGYVYLVNGVALHLFGLGRLTHLKQLSALDERFAQELIHARPGARLNVCYNNERGTADLAVNVSGVTLRGKTLRILTVSDIGGELDQKEIESWIRLIRVLTHEIMNNITPIVSLSDTLVTLIGKDEESMRSGLETIRSTGKSLMAFVESYRKFTRIPVPQRQAFYIGPLLRRIVRLGVPPGGPDISIDVTPKDLMLYGDENLLGQVLLNLVKNSTEALSGRSDGEIRLSAQETTGQKIVLTVSDNGPGILPEVAEQIFVPFFTTKENGSGIGLSISKQIVRMHGGHIRLKPSGDGSGATFELIF